MKAERADPLSECNRDSLLSQKDCTNHSQLSLNTLCFLIDSNERVHGLAAKTLGCSSHPEGKKSGTGKNGSPIDAATVWTYMYLKACGLKALLLTCSAVGRW